MLGNQTNENYRRPPAKHKYFMDRQSRQGVGLHVADVYFILFLYFFLILIFNFGFLGLIFFPDPSQ